MFPAGIEIDKWPNGSKLFGYLYVEITQRENTVQSLNQSSILRR